MGFMDNFTTDGTVEMKHAEYYGLMREAAKAELIENAVKAEVPGFYVRAMITGEKPEFLKHNKLKEENTGFSAEYEQMTGAAASIFEAWTKENGVESAAASMHRIIDTMAQNRLDELKTVEENRKEHEERMKEAVKKAVEAMGHMPVISMEIDFGKGKEKQDTEEAACRDRWSCRTCGNCKPVRIDMDLCRNCEDGSNYTKTDDEEEEAHELKEAEGQQEESEGAKNGNE